MIGTGQKLQYYFEEKLEIHLSCGSDRFYNGVIFEINLEKEFILFNDNKLGVVPVLFEEITKIEPFREKEWDVRSVVELWFGVMNGNNGSAMIVVER